MAVFIVNIILSVIAVITGLLSLLFFFIGFADDKDMYIPGLVWLMLCIGCIAASYLLTHAGSY